MKRDRRAKQVDEMVNWWGPDALNDHAWSEEQTVNEPKFIIEEVTDPAEIARHKIWHEKASRNSQWLETHWADVLPQAYGKFIAVAGQEAFIADTTEEAVARARAAHPDDEGLLSQYVFPAGGPRIYGNRRKLAQG